MVNKKSFFLFGMMIVLLGIVSFTIFNQAKPATNAPDDTNEPSVKEQLQSMFMEDGKVSYFSGDGGEYSSYTQITYWLDENHVQLIIDNTAVMATEIYRITDNEIQLLLTGVYDEPFVSNRLSSYKDFQPMYVSSGSLPFDPSKEQSLTLQEALTQLQPVETYFRLPLGVGDSMEQFKLVNILEEVTVSSGTYKNVYVLENKTEDFIETNYFASPGGFIKWKHDLPNNNFEINGELHSIFGDWASKNTELAIKSIDGKETKNIILNDYPILKNFLLYSAITEEMVNEIFYARLPSSLDITEIFIIKIPFYGASYLNFLIFNQNNDIKELPLGESYGKEVPEIHYSPSGNQFIYRLDAPYIAEKSNPDYLVTQLVLIDLLKQERMYPTEESILFDIISIPITSIQWTNENSFTVEAAAISPASYDEIEQWYKSEERPTNLLNFTIE